MKRDEEMREVDYEEWYAGLSEVERRRMREVEDEVDWEGVLDRVRRDGWW